MTPQTDFAALPEQSGANPQFYTLSAEDQQALAAMLDEEPPASLAGFKVDEAFRHRGQEYRVRARGPYRIAVESRCARCDFPFIAAGSPGYLLKRLSTRCQHCRPGPKGKHRKWSVIDPCHELSRRKEIAGDRNFTPGDFIVRGGHGYLIRRRRELWHERSGRTLQGYEAIGLCATCRTPFIFTASASQLDSRYLTRRCELHRVAGQRSHPVKWTRKAAREAWERF